MRQKADRKEGKSKNRKKCKDRKMTEKKVKKRDIDEDAESRQI